LIASDPLPSGSKKHRAKTGEACGFHPVLEKSALGILVLLFAAEAVATPNRDHRRARRHRCTPAWCPAVAMATMAHREHCAGVDPARRLRLARALSVAARAGRLGYIAEPIAAHALAIGAIGSLTAA
jgi:hypothetical protein